MADGRGWTLDGAEIITLAVDRSGTLPGQLQRVADERLPLRDGQVRLRIDRFSLSANNLTYALLGERMGYWALFPVGEPWGVVPAWGFATVVDSADDRIVRGERLYGLWPMASEAVLEPGRVNARLIVENSPHRRALPPAYNSYFRLASDPIHAPGSEDRQAVLRPLFITSFLLDRDVAASAESGTVIVTSASSKTALGLGWLLRNRSDKRSIGVTSPRNRDAVTALGLFDTVATYDDLPPSDGAVIIDFSGDHDMLDRLRGNGTGARLCRVGLTHWRDGSEELKPRGTHDEFFFAPDAIIKAADELGPAGFDAALAAATRAFIAASRPWLGIETVRGGEAIGEAWSRLRFGSGDPTSAIVASF